MPTTKATRKNKRAIPGRAKHADASPPVGPVATKVGQALTSTERAADIPQDLHRLAGNLAHELNNLLGPMLAYPDLMLGELPPDHGIREDLVVIRDSARRALGVVQDLLVLSGKMGVQEQAVPLHGVLKAFLHSSRCKAMLSRARSIELDVALARGNPQIRSSLHLLNRAFEHMLDLALLMAPARCKLRVETRLIGEPAGGSAMGSYIALNLALPKDTAARDLDPGSIPGALESRFLLGRAVLTRIARELGGAAVFGADPFISLHLPATGASTEKTPPLAIRRPTGQHVLVVDDDEVQRLLASRVLQTLGYKVETARNGAQALEKLGAQPFELVVLDMIMEAGFDGLETYREIINAHPGQRCIITSAYADEARLQEALSLGPAFYLPKPYTMQDFSLLVEKTLATSPVVSSVDSP